MTNSSAAVLRYEIQVQWMALTAAHVGSGAWDELTAAEAGPELAPEQRPFAAALVLDAEGKPCLPGSSTKGVLKARAVAQGLEAALQARLFGSVDPQAPAREEPVSTPGIAEFGTATWRQGRTSIDARTAINRHTRTVADGKLFHMRWVEPGAVFTQRIVLQAAAGEEVATLLALLQGCSDSAPLLMGRSTRSGHGRFKCMAEHTSVHVVTPALLQTWLDEPSGYGTIAPYPMRKLTPEELQALLKQAKPCTADGPTLSSLQLPLRLAFSGPFAVRDPSYRKAGPADPDTQPRGYRAQQPVLPGTSFLGALRSQAERIEATLRAEAAIAAGHTVRPDQPARQGAAATRSLADWVFGCAGWRGLFGVAGPLIGACGQVPMPQHMVALCRITGGGRDTAKFQMAAWVNPTVEGMLTLDTRRLAHCPAELRLAAMGLLQLTLQDLAFGDISFGMGRSKGWGWVKPDPDLARALAAQWWAHLAPEGTTAAPAADALRCALLQHLGLAGDTLRPPLAITPPTAQPQPTPAAGHLPTLQRSPGGSAFHNPYHFLPFPQLAARGTSPAMPADDLAAQAQALGHSHGIYQPGRLTGEITVRLNCITPLFIGGGRGTSTHAQQPVKVEPFKWHGRPAIPGTSLRGLLSQWLEPMSGSAMRVLDSERLMSVRAAVSKDPQDKVFRGVVFRPDEVETGYHELAIRDEGAEEWPIALDAAERLHQLADERWADKGEKLDRQYSLADLERLSRSRQPNAPKLHVPKGARDQAFQKAGKLDLLPGIDWAGRDEFVAIRNPDPDKLGSRARLMPGQEVFFKLAWVGPGEATHAREVAWSAIYRETRWVTTPIDSGPLTLGRMVAMDNAERLPLGERPSRALFPAEWLLGAVDRQGPADSSALAFAGKIAVSMGLPVGTVLPWMPEIPLKELASPKPPSPALYMRRKDGKAGGVGKSEFIRDPTKHALQGTKVYLHAQRNQNGMPVALDAQGRAAPGGPGQATGMPPWQSGKAANAGKQETSLSDRQVKVTPIPAGQAFEFTVRFENLDADELALLCAAIQPGDGFEHKLGMGRPIGLGSVKLSLQSLVLRDPALRYHQGQHGLVQAADPAAWARQGMATLAQRDARIFKAMQLLGDPRHVQAPVHYPQCDGAPIETRNFDWWMVNEHAGQARQSLKPLDAASPPASAAPPRPSARKPGRR